MNTKLAASLIAVCLTFSAGVLAQKKEGEKAQANKPAEKSSTSSSSAALDTPKAKNSYAIGMTIGKNLAHEGIDVDTAIFLRGMNDSLSGAKPLMSEDEARSTIMALEQQGHAKRDAELKKMGEENKKEGDAFLAANKSKQGVVTLPSGLQYKVIKQGDGPKPVATDMVVCNYRGTLINGKEFDSSYKRGQPATFPVGGVIRGWTEILQLMPVGSNYQVFIPADLAYGARPPSAEIGPNSTLIFDIELLSIKEKPEDAKKAPAQKAPEASKSATQSAK
jgi:FKBP-type peptidyl-prolyl cis-trans isomerase FklB